MGLCNLGLKAICGLAGNIDTQTAFGYLAVGTGTTAFSAAQTTLVAEVSDSGLSRAAVTPTSEQTTVADDTLQFVKTFSVTGSKTVAEVGTFNAASNGVMLSRYVLGATRSLVNGDTYTLTIKYVFA